MTLVTLLAIGTALRLADHARCWLGSKRCRFHRTIWDDPAPPRARIRRSW